MFKDNLKECRKKKGYSQEELAIKLNVVRQTVSKWEKGLSVPDVDMLMNIADALDVNVSQLLDIQLPEIETNGNEVAEQLGKIAEQMAIKNQRSNKTSKSIKKAFYIILIIVLIIGVPIVSIKGWYDVNEYRANKEYYKNYHYMVDGEEYHYRVVYDRENLVRDVFPPDECNFDCYKYNQLNDLDAALKMHFEEIGATDITEEYTE